jgi:hypothetical protein
VKRSTHLSELLVSARDDKDIRSGVVSDRQHKPVHMSHVKVHLVCELERRREDRVQAGRVKWCGHVWAKPTHLRWRRRCRQSAAMLSVPGSSPEMSVESVSAARFTYSSLRM